MAIFVNNVEIEKVYLNGVENKITYLNGVEVDRASEAPGSLTISASKGTSTSGTFIYFSPTTGIPTPTYDLYRNNSLIASSISSGYLDTSGTPDTEYSYKVKAKNSAGYSFSNTDIGYKKKVYSNWFEAEGDTNWIVPAGVNSIKVSIIGGGGGACRRFSGNGGDVTTVTRRVSPGDVVSFSSGSRGIGRLDSGVSGGKSTVSHNGSQFAYANGGLGSQVNTRPMSLITLKGDTFSKGHSSGGGAGFANGGYGGYMGGQGSKGSGGGYCTGEYQGSLYEGKDGGRGAIIIGF